MKKVLLGLLGLVVVSAIGLLGYVIYNELANPENMGEAIPVDASSQSSSQSQSQSQAQAEIRLHDMRAVETTTEILSAISHEMTQNRHTVGWLNITDTKISNSVVQADNNAYYLNVNERGEADIFGAYFADYTCNFGNRSELSANTVIYGHSDVSGTEDQPDARRFSQLFKYTDYEFARTHPVLTFSTPQETMTWQVFAVYYTDLDLDFTRTEMDGTALVELANSAKARSIYDYGVTVDENDKIISLVTCTLKYGNDSRSQVRYVVAAKLLDEGETPVTITQLKQNENPLQPSIK